jgi:heptosyltransferase-2
LTSLVVQTAFLGDVVLTTPLLTVLAERHGPVDVVTTPAAAPLLETHPAVRRVFPYAKRGSDRGIGGLLALAARLRAEGHEIAYLPHRSLRSAALARLAGIPRRIGFADGWPVLYTETRQRPTAGHEIDRLLTLAGPVVAGAPSRHAPPALVTTIDDRIRAEGFLREHGIGTGPFVALAPGSIWGSKRWHGYADLAARLAGSRGPAIVVVGGPEDAALGSEVTAAVAQAGGKGASACGRLSLRESVELIRRASVLVTNDSAPLHFAQAVGTACVAVFGPTLPAFGFGPRGPRDQTLGVDGLACRPCSRHGPTRCPLGHHLCMTSLRVDDVLHAIEETGALHRRD